MVVSSELYPFAGSYLDLAGNRLHYLDEGRGEPLVMLHGNPTWSFYYRNLVKAFRDRYRTIVPDHIGCGKSDKPAAGAYPYTLEQRVRDLEALLEKLAIGDNITLIVHDWGGMIGMAYATRHPEKIKRLVILNTGAFHLPKTKPFPWSLWFCRTPLFGSLLVRGANAFSRAAVSWCVTRKPLTPEIRHGYLAPYDTWHDRVAVLRFVQDIPLRPGDAGFDLVSRVEENIGQFRKLPTVICWGEQDFVFDRHFLKQWTEYLPEARVHRFPDAGHYVLEDAGEEIVAIVSQFLKDNPSMSDASELVNIAAHLPAMARHQPHRQAVVFPHGRDASGRVSYTHLTFRQLDDASDHIAAGLTAYGITRGMRSVLMVTPSLDFFALTFALFKMGAVPVMIDPGMGVRNLGKCLAEAEPEAFIGIPKAHVARCLFRWGNATITRLVTVGRRFFWGGETLAAIRQRIGPNHNFKMAATQADEVAAILFTSGSTGVPKGVVYTHGIFDSQVKKLKAIYHIQPGEIDLPTFPLFALFAPALGMTAIIPDMDATRPAHVDPRMIAECIENFGVTNMFGSPALINRVSRYGVAMNLSFPSLKRVISAGAPVSAAILERFSKMLEPGAQIFTPYGATEALPVASIGSHEILSDTASRTNEGGGICLGKPVAGMEVKVIRITDEPIVGWSEELVLPDGEIGEIAVKGENVTREYYNRPDSTRLAKISDSTHGGFYHRMGDVGYLDDTGRLWFCGRKSHRVVTDAGTLFTIPCEAIFNTHPAVFRTALVGLRRNGKMEPVLCVELDAEARAPAEAVLRDELLKLGARHALTQGIQTILFHPAFPVDIRHNAKIFREKLAIWAAQQ